MNRTYALVWNHALRAWSVAHEHARRRGKGAGAVLAAALLLPLTAIAADLPTGGQVVSGSGAINQPNAQQMVIDQASNKLAIDWQSFDIGTGNKVTFNQPGRDAITLNRVLGADGSKIMGQLDANGRVFLINPNGVLFGAGAQVNVGGLVASTLNISDSDFAAGNYKFKGDGSNASVINNGQITAADGGSIALLGGTVSNNGVIVANQGTVALAAGNAVTLDFAGDGLLNVQVDEAVVDALVENHQLIKADGGQVLLTANAGDALLKTVVNNTGVIEAQTLGEKDGKIVLLGSFDGGTVQVAGTLDASAPKGGDGGFIETSGANVKVADSAKVTTQAQSGKTGTWLIDPNDFTISAGSTAQTDGGIGATTLSNNLASNNVTLVTDNTAGSDAGNINVNAAVSWSANTTLTLNAYNNINVNAAITATGANAGLVLNYGNSASAGSATSGTNYNIAAPVTLSGANASLSINGNSYTLIQSMGQLDALDGASGMYALAADLDASGTPYSDAVVSGTFSGTFAGLGHTVSNLTVNALGDAGLFSQNAGFIRDVGMVGGSVQGSNAGGLVGSNFSSGSITNAYATGSVISNDGDAGGLVGSNFSSGSITNAYATGSVSSNSIGGGVGGLVGSNFSSGSITNAYATGSVSSNDGDAGGLVGSNFSSGSITNAYATGSVSSNSIGGGVGGLVGRNFSSGSITNASWDSTTTRQTVAVGSDNGTTTNVSAVTSSTAYSHSNYANLGTWAETATGSGVWVATSGSANQWVMIEGSTRPFLYSEYSTSIGNAHQLQLMAYDLGASYTLSRHIDASGTTGSNTSGMWTASGFSPVGNDDVRFTGSLDGNGHTISDLTVNRNGESNVGLFGFNAGSVSNLGLLGGSVTGAANVGALVGYNTGTVSGSYSTASVTGDFNIGGLLGYSDGLLSNSYASGNVTGNTNVGGVLGNNSGLGIVSKTYATGTVSDSTDAGALVGWNNGSVTASFWLLSNGSIGVAHNDDPQTAIVDSLTHGLSATEAKTASTYTDAGWDITINGGSSSVWRIYDGYSAPLLRSFLTALTVTTHDVSKTYDGSALSNNGYTLSNASPDSSLLLGTASTGIVGSSKNAGSYAIKTSGLYSTSQQGYDLNYVDGTATIGKATLSVSGGITAIDKTYDGTTTAAYTSGGIGGTIYGSDNVTLSQSGAFADKNAGVGKTVTVSLSGTDAGNYTLTGNTATATITPKALTITGVTAADKTYDGTTTAMLSGGTLSGLVGSETLGVTGLTATFDDKNAGTGKTVTVSGATLADGTGLASNYTINNPTDLTANITQTALTIDGMSVLNKVYDGSTQATLSGGSLSGLVGSETLGVTGLTATFDDKNAGTGKTVTVSGATLADGTGLASNYTINNPTGLTANITQKALTITGLSASDKVYDGNTGAALAGGTLSGLISGETLALNGMTGTFSDKNAGTGKTVTVSGATLADGTGLASNYTVAQPVAVTANINKAALTVTANSSQVTYNGQQQNIAGFTASGLVNGETASVLSGVSTSGGSGINAGSYSHSASGSDDNYDLTFVDGNLTINKAALTITALDASKTFGQSIALTGYSASGLVGNDSISAVSLNSLGQPTTAAAGSYAIVASDAVGAALSNYDIDYQDGTLLVSPEPVATPSTANSQPYIGAMVANSQTIAAPESTSPASEPEVLNPQMLMTNPLADIMNLQVINQGIRLPEGI